MKETWQARIHGRVQGVGYRESCAHQAYALGITGWVRNRSDGSVEAVLHGTPEQLSAMRNWLWHGPTMARVSQVEIHPGDGEFDVFEVRSSY